MDFLFFQAEDGIRYLVRSRGLGDVYKRQAFAPTFAPGAPGTPGAPMRDLPSDGSSTASSPMAVSYTHLTLPTSDLV